MADFINTVDVLGDDVLTAVIIERSITEYKDDMVTNIGDNSFAYCTALTIVDLPVVKNIGNSAFLSCSNLAALILRNASQVASLYSSNSLNDSGIKKDTGYIYVPAVLVDSYKAATNWSTYAARFRALEDYTVDGTITGELDPNKI